jgi:hypothetical protein
MKSRTESWANLVREEQKISKIRKLQEEYHASVSSLEFHETYFPSIELFNAQVSTANAVG